MSHVNGAEPPPFVQVILDPGNPSGPPVVQSNLDPLTALMLLARGMARAVQHVNQTCDVRPKSAVVMPDGSPPPSGRAGG